MHDLAKEHDSLQDLIYQDIIGRIKSASRYVIDIEKVITGRACFENCI